MQMPRIKPCFCAIPTIAILLVLATLCSDSRAAEPKRRPNVLFLLSDDQRPDTIAALGNRVIKTPNLDALVRRGTTFTQAVCANPICTPSRGEILSGCSGFRSGVIDFGGKLDPQLVLWPVAMRKAGYVTSYVGKWHNDGRPIQRGFDGTIGLYRGGGGKFWKGQTDWKGSPITGYRGWIFQDDSGKLFPERGVGLTPNISGLFADAAIDVIRRKTEQPWFLQVSFTAPHDPLIMPPGFEDMYSIDEIPLPPNFLPEHPFDHGNLRGRDETLLPFPRTPEMVRDVLRMYYAVISHMDRQIGRILLALEETGQADNTIVIFTSDHGLGVGSHGIRGKQNMYEHTAGVPLILAGPGIPRGERRKAQVYLRELYPTTCDLVGIDIPETVEGLSFAAVVQGNTESIHDSVFCYFRDVQRMIRTDRWKLIHYPQVDRWQLFDRIADPSELHNLVDDIEKSQVLAKLRRQLVELQRSHKDPLAK
jgi:arylsulfatase A-like enzyme